MLPLTRSGGIGAGDVGAEGFGTAYRFRAAGGSYTGEPLPVDLACEPAALGLRVIRATTVRDLREALQAPSLPSASRWRSEQ